MKMSIGQGNHSGHDINRGRFMRTVYVPLDEKINFNWWTFLKMLPV